MVSRLSGSKVSLVHQMPFTTDQIGLAAAIEKVRFISTVPKNSEFLFHGFVGIVSSQDPLTPWNFVNLPDSHIIIRQLFSRMSFYDWRSGIFRSMCRQVLPDVSHDGHQLHHRNVVSRQENPSRGGERFLLLWTFPLRRFLPYLISARKVCRIAAQ